MDRELAVIGTLCNLLDSVCKDTLSERRDASIDEKRRLSPEINYVGESKRPKLTKLVRCSHNVFPVDSFVSAAATDRVCAGELSRR